MDYTSRESRHEELKQPCNLRGPLEIFYDFGTRTGLSRQNKPDPTPDRSL